VPAALKTFLLALAIIDDLMAIIVIAVFYTDELSILSLLLAAIGMAGLVLLNRLGVRRPSAYVLVGIFTWVCVLKSGVHATLAGVAVGLAIPLARHEGQSLLEEVEHALKPWVTFAIVPAFAFANAGLSFSGISLAALAAPIPLGIAAGLLIGKSLGVGLFCALAIGLGIAARPAGASSAQLYGIAVLTGIGFTMSLFIGTLAFEDPAAMAMVQLGVMAGSLLSGLLATLILLLAARPHPSTADKIAAG